MTTHYTFRPDGEEHSLPPHPAKMSPIRKRRIEEIKQEQKFILEELEIEKGLVAEPEPPSPRNIKQKRDFEQKTMHKKAKAVTELASRKTLLSGLKLLAIHSEKLYGDPIYEDLVEQQIKQTELIIATEKAMIKKELVLNDNELRLFKMKKTLYNSLQNMLRSVITTHSDDDRQVQLVKCYKWFDEKKQILNTQPLDITLIKKLKREKVERRMDLKGNLKEEAFLPPLRKTEKHEDNAAKLLSKNNRLQELQKLKQSLDCKRGEEKVKKQTFSVSRNQIEDIPHLYPKHADYSINEPLSKSPDGKYFQTSKDKLNQSMLERKPSLDMAYEYDKNGFRKIHFDPDTVDLDANLKSLLEANDRYNKRLANHFKTVKKACLEHGRDKARSEEKRTFIYERERAGTQFQNLKASLPCQKVRAMHSKDLANSFLTHKVALPYKEEQDFIVDSASESEQEEEEMEAPQLQTQASPPPKAYMFGYMEESEEEEERLRKEEEELEQKRIEAEQARIKKLRVEEETRLRRQVKDLSKDEGPLNVHPKIDNTEQLHKIRELSHTVQAQKAVMQSLVKPDIETELQKETTKEKIRLIRKFKAQCIDGGYPKPLEDQEEQEAKEIGNVLNNPSTITLSLFSKPLPEASKVNKTFLKQTEGLNFNKEEFASVKKQLEKVEAENSKMTKPRVRVKKDDKKPGKKKEEVKVVEKPPAPKILGPLTDLRKSMGSQALEYKLEALEEARNIKNYLARECRVREEGQEKDKEQVVDVPLDTLVKAILLAPDLPVHQFYGGEGKYPKPSDHLFANPFPPKKKKGKKKKKK